jgi:hypothetical protein
MPTRFSRTARTDTAISAPSSVRLRDLATRSAVTQAPRVQRRRTSSRTMLWSMGYSTGIDATGAHQLNVPHASTPAATDAPQPIRTRAPAPSGCRNRGEPASVHSHRHPRHPVAAKSLPSHGGRCLDASPTRPQRAGALLPPPPMQQTRLHGCGDVRPYAEGRVGVRIGDVDDVVREVVARRHCSAQETVAPASDGAFRSASVPGRSRVGIVDQTRT